MVDVIIRLDVGNSVRTRIEPLTQNQGLLSLSRISTDKLKSKTSRKYLVQKEIDCKSVCKKLYFRGYYL